MEREVAWRIFAREYSDSAQLLRAEEERMPNYILTPTGARVNRLLAMGVLVDVENKGTEEEPLWWAKINDPTGFFFVFAGQHQREAAAVLSTLKPPAFVAVVGKIRTYTPPGGDRMYTSIRAESVKVVSEADYNCWILDAARSLKERLSALSMALDTPEPTVDGLTAKGVRKEIAEGVLMALESYGNINMRRYRDMLISSLQFLLPEYENMPLVSSQASGVEEDAGAGEEVLEKILSIIEELDTTPQGALWEDIMDRAREMGIGEEELEEGLNILVDRGEVYEPTLGRIKRV